MLPPPPDPFRVALLRLQRTCCETQAVGHGALGHTSRPGPGSGICISDRPPRCRCLCGPHRSPHSSGTASSTWEPARTAREGLGSDVETPRELQDQPGCCPSHPHSPGEQGTLPSGPVEPLPDLATWSHRDDLPTQIASALSC